MALAAGPKNRQGSGNVPFTVFFDISGANADAAGDIDLAHNEGVVPTMVDVQLTSGNATAVLSETLANRTANNVRIRSNVALTANMTARVYITFGSMDAPAVT